MPTRYWTCHWQIKYWRPAINAEGDPINHNAGNSFRRLGVSSGDVIYVISLKGGQLFLGGRTVADKIVSREEAIKALGTDNLWDSNEHLLSKEGSGSRLDLRRRLSPELTRQLRFIFKTGESGPCFMSTDKLDNQATRGVKEITKASAELLDRIIEVTDKMPRSAKVLMVTERMLGPGHQASDDGIPLPEEYRPKSAFFEGAMKTVEVNRYERDRNARNACIAFHGVSCSVCGFNFASAYGASADGFIHVHHLLPLSSAEGEHAVDPVKDLRPVCPNCHAMIHLGGECRSIEQVREMIRR